MEHLGCIPWCLCYRTRSQHSGKSFMKLEVRLQSAIDGWHFLLSRHITLSLPNSLFIPAMLSEPAHPPAPAFRRSCRIQLDSMFTLWTEALYNCLCHYFFVVSGNFCWVWDWNDVCCQGEWSEFAVSFGVPQCHRSSSCTYVIMASSFMVNGAKFERQAIRCTFSVWRQHPQHYWQPAYSSQTIKAMTVSWRDLAL